MCFINMEGDKFCQKLGQHLNYTPRLVFSQPGSQKKTPAVLPSVCHVGLQAAEKMAVRQEAALKK